MGLITQIVGLIRGSVGNNMDNNEDDVMRIKSALNKVGYFRGLITRLNLTAISQKK